MACAAYVFLQAARLSALCQCLMRKFDTEIQDFLHVYNSCHMVYKKIKFNIFAVLFVLACYPSCLLASSFVTLTNLGVDNRDGALSVGFNIEIIDAAPLLDALQSDGAFDIVCEAEIVRRRPALWNEFLGTTSYTCTLTSNTMARECTVSDARGTHTFAFAQLAAELNRYWRGLTMPLLEWEQVRRNNVYLLRVSFKIARTNGTQWASKPLFFINQDLLPETVYELEVEY